MMDVLSRECGMEEVGVMGGDGCWWEMALRGVM